MKRRITLRKSFISLFFALQIIGIVVTKFSDVKYFCWAPYDEISRYKISVMLEGDKLDSREIQHRYRTSAKGRENRSISNLISVIRQYETTYGSKQNAIVKLSYLTNGHEERVWIWPDDKIISKN